MSELGVPDSSLSECSVSVSEYSVRVQSFRFHCVRVLCVGDTVYKASQQLPGGGGWE